LDCRNICDITGLYQLDKCNNCLLLSDENWDSCVGCDGIANSNTTWKCGKCVALNSIDYEHACDNNSTGSINNSSKTSSITMTMILIIISIAAFILFVIIGYIVYRLWKQQKDVNTNFQSILSTYQMMDERKIKKSKETKQQDATILINDNVDEENDDQTT